MTASLLDFTLSPTRRETVRFDVLDEDLNLVSQVYPTAPPSLVIDTSRTIKRSLEGFSLLPGDTQRLSRASRIRPVWVLDDGSEYPCGVFVLSDETVLADAPTEGLQDAVLGDQMSLYREPLERSVTIWPGMSILDFIVGLHQQATSPAPNVRWTHLTDLARQSGSWPAGTVLAEAMAEAAEMAGARVWFDINGYLVIDRADPEPEPVDLSAHIDGTLKFSYSNEDLPNRWIARDNDQDFSVTGVYDLPAEAPHSFANRGRRVTREEVVSGLANQDAADAAAREMALAEPIPYKTFTLEVPGRPDLDAWTPVRLSNGQVFQVETVSTELGPCGTTTVSGQALWDLADTLAFEPRSTVEGSPVYGNVPPLNEKILWNPAFLRHWKSLTPAQRRKLRRWLNERERQRQERLERRRRRQARHAARQARKRKDKKKRKLKAGRVTTVDPETRVATVLLDGDEPGDEIVARLGSDMPGSEQRVTVEFGSPVPTVSGIIGGHHRLLGWAKGDPAGSNQTVLNGNTGTVRDTEIEVAITQPGRTILVLGSGLVSPTNATNLLTGRIQRDDGEGGAFTTIGSWGQLRNVSTVGATLMSGWAIDYLPDPGIYRYRLALQVAASGDGTIVKQDYAVPQIIVMDVGGGREGTDDPYSTDAGAEKGGYGG